MSSSPLRWFRKNQKWLIAIATVFLMFVFTLSMGSSGIDPLLDMFAGGSARNRNNPVVVSWNDGTLREADLMRLRQERTYLRNLLGGVMMTLRERQGQSFTAPLGLDTSDEGLLELVLVNQAAQDYGLEVTDETVLDYLDRLAGAGTVKRSEILQLWQNITRGQGTEAQLLALLRRELLSRNLQLLVWQGGGASSPLQIWDLFNRLERKIEAEFLAFPVEPFISDVQEPSESELRAYFQKYKDIYQEPGSDTPGFKQRERMAFDYVEFSYDKLLEQELANIDEDDVRKFYEDNKDSFTDTSLPSSDLEIEVEDAAQAGAQEGAMQDDTAQPDISTEDNAATSAAKEDAAAEDKAPADNAEMPTEETEETREPEEPEDGMGESSTSSNEGTDSETEPAADDPQQSAGPAVGDASEGGSEDGDTAVEIDPSLTPVPQDNATTPAMTDDEATTDAPSADRELGERESEGNQEAETESTDPETPTRYLPFEEVQNQIREEIAAPIVRKKMERMILKARARMDSYYGEYLAWETGGKEAGIPAPALPTFEDLGEGIDLKVNSMPLVDRFETMRMEGLGSSVDFRFDGRQVRQTQFTQVAFGNKLQPFQGQSFPGPNSKIRYVYWVTDRMEPHSPSFEDVRNQVVVAWKAEEARELARAEAERSAETARSKGGPLSDALAAEGRQFIRSGQISWMTGGSVDIAGGGRARLGDIPGVDRPGQEMMRGLFRMQPGEVGVLWNQPKSAAYVARVIASSPSVDFRQELFLTSGTSVPGIADLVVDERQQMLVGWYRGHTDALNVNWEREPRLAAE